MSSGLGARERPWPHQGYRVLCHAQLGVRWHRPSAPR